MYLKMKPPIDRGSRWACGFMIPCMVNLARTTDTPILAIPRQIKVEADDIDYLLTAANHFCNPSSWKKSDIIGQYAGLRVLKQSSKTSPSAVSRDWNSKLPITACLLLLVENSPRHARTQLKSSIRSVKIYTSMNLVKPMADFSLATETDFCQWSANTLVEARALHIDDEAPFGSLSGTQNESPLIFELLCQ